MSSFRANDSPPDIVIVDAGFAATNPIRYPPSTVLLAVEIVSPGSRATDRAIKPDLYAEAKIPIYWRVELEPAPQVFVSILSDGGYVEKAAARAGNPEMLAASFPIEIDPAVLAGRAG